VSGNVVNVKGKKGALSQTIEGDINIKINEGKVEVTRPTDQKRHRALHGLYRSLIANMVH
jgi:large subunit ribosomal protein L6